MSDLLLDLPMLEQLHTDLSGIAQDFTNAIPVSHELSGAVGDGGLASAVSDFADGWDIRRHKITDSLNAINASIQAIHDTFVQVDSKLAAALTTGK